MAGQDLKRHCCLANQPCTPGARCPGSHRRCLAAAACGSRVQLRGGHGAPQLARRALRLRRAALGRQPHGALRRRQHACAAKQYTISRHGAPQMARRALRLRGAALGRQPHGALRRRQHACALGQCTINRHRQQYYMVSMLRPHNRRLGPWKPTAALQKVADFSVTTEYEDAANM